MAQNIDTGLMLRMEASLAKFEKQMARATQVGSGTAVGLEKRFDKMGASMASSSAKAATGLGKVVQIGGAGRFVLQNTAAQIGDMAVQMEMGTSASRILSQQLPQLFGGFGALGGALGLVAPLLGTVAAVGIPLAAMFFTLGGKTDEAKEKVKSFSDKLSEAEAALGRAESAMISASSGGIETLRKKYGDVSIAVSELALALADIELRAAAADIKALFDPAVLNGFGDRLTSELGALGTAVVGATEGEIKGLEDQLAGLQEQLAATLAVEPNGNSFTDILSAQIANLQENIALLKGDLDSAGDRVGQLGPDADVIGRYRALRTALSDALNAQNFEAAANAARDLKDLIVETAGEGDAAADAMTRIEDLARQAANRFSQAEANARGIGDAAAGATTQVGAAADEAARLSGNLAGALAQLAGIASGIATANRLAASAAQRRIDYAGDPVGLAGANARADVNEQTGSAAYAAIRSGNTPVLNEIAKISQQTDGLVAGAEAAAQLEENARAAESAAAAAVKAASGGTKKSGGSKGGSSKTETPIFASSEVEIQNIQRQIEALGKTKAEVAELTARYRLLDEAKRRGMTVTDELSARIDAEAAKVGELAGAYEAATDKMKAIEDVKAGIDAISQSMADAIVNGESLGDAFSNVLKRMASDMMASGISSLVNGLFNGGGTGSGGILARVFGGFRAAGGPVSGGKTYMVGERGPELFTPPGAGQIIPNHKLGDRSSPSAVHVTVGVSADSNGNLMPFVQSVTQRGVRQGMAQVRGEVPGIVARHTKVAG